MARRCKECGAELESGWKYCPFCGEKVQPRWKNVLEFGMEDLMEKMLSMVNEFTREFWKIEMDGGIPEKRTQKHIVKIRITPAGIKVEESDRSNVDASKSDVSVNSDRKKKRMYKKVKEPKIRSIKRENGVIEVELEVDGIEGAEDVEIVQLEESTEFRAYGKNEMYFKILDIPRSYQLVENRVKNNTVYLKFSLSG